MKTGMANSGLSLDQVNGNIKGLKSGRIKGWPEIRSQLDKLPVARLDPVAENFRATKVARLTKAPDEITQYAKFGSKVGLNVTKTEVVSGVLLSSGRLVTSAVKTGAGAGLLTFAIDGGIATVQHIQGTLLDADYERQLNYAAIKGASVGGSIAVAVVLGATPTGWVVLGVGAGAYIITDFAVQWHEDKRNFSNLTIDDLKAFGIPASNLPDWGIPQ